MEIRNESINKDNSHSWVRISHGLNKLVTDLIDKEYDDNEQETSETKTEVFALTDIEPQDHSPIAYPVSKELSTSLRHGHLPREEDGAIQFWRLQDYLRNDFV